MDHRAAEGAGGGGVSVERGPLAPRVLFLLEGFLPEMTGGMQTHAHGLAERLIDRGCPTAVLTRRMVPGTPARDRVGRVELHRIGPDGPLKGKGLAAAAPLAAFLGGCLEWLHANRGLYDVMLVHGVKVLPAPALLAGRALGKPVVLKPESPAELWQAISDESAARMHPALARGLVGLAAGARNRLVRRGDRCVAISGEIAGELARAGVSAGRVVRIPNGIDTGRFAPAAPGSRGELRRRLGLPEAGVITLFTGRLARSKGVLVLVDAWRRAVAAAGTDDHCLVLVGEGAGSFDDCEAELRRLAGCPDLAGRLILPGAVADVAPYLWTADLFAFPSDYEGFGLSLVEAMACGLPVVTTRVGVAAEAVEDGVHGRAVPPRDAAAFGGALAWALAHRDRWPAFGRAAREAVERRYGLAAVAERYHRMLTQLLAARSPGGRGDGGRARP